jgi:hypothetical protein
VWASNLPSKSCVKLGKSLPLSESPFCQFIELGFSALAESPGGCCPSQGGVGGGLVGVRGQQAL